VKQHKYEVAVVWTGNAGSGTAAYTSYRRDHEISGSGKQVIPGSSDPAFRGDPTRYNPEELLVASLSSCHMLWYLHRCATNKISVLQYSDNATGWMEERADGCGAFVSVVLRPRVTIRRGDDQTKAVELHHEAHRMCFIANSVTFPVKAEPEVREMV
jgi:organic hydroperoxide reductase OsmC/OhrA